MGKSLKGKELGKGISQRKDGLYQARFINRFGERQTLYDKTYSGITKKIREEQYTDDRGINVISSNITLDEWFEKWLTTFKINCRNSTITTYTINYKRIKDELGWRKLKDLKYITLQETFNKLKSDNSRKKSKAVLVDMLNKAVDSNLMISNPAIKINTIITKERKKERRVLTKKETEIFLSMAEGTFYYNLYVLALETGMRIGELCGLMWEDIDLKKRVINVQHNLCYFSKENKSVHEMHDTKTSQGNRTIPLTDKALFVLKRQKLTKQELILKGKIAPSEYQNLVFTTRQNKPTQRYVIQSSIETIIKKIQKENEDFQFFSTHSFRHTFATRAIENGMNPKTLQKLLGHSSLNMTMDLYCHVTEETLFDEMKKMEERYII